MDPFIAQIVLFGGNFAPRGWAFCDGQLLAISSHSSLFRLLGTNYGGDGRTTFALPDLRGRVSIHPGNGPGLSPYRLGQRGGQEDVTLTLNQIPNHNHTFHAATQPADNQNPNGDALAAGMFYHNTASPSATLNDNSVGRTGGGQSHTNIQPYECVNYIIALVGVYPSRS